MSEAVIPEGFIPLPYGADKAPDDYAGGECYSIFGRIGAGLAPDDERWPRVAYYEPAEQHTLDPVALEASWNATCDEANRIYAPNLTAVHYDLFKVAILAYINAAPVDPIAQLEAELKRRDDNETRNCINWGPCSRNDHRMSEASDEVSTNAHIAQLEAENARLVEALRRADDFLCQVGGMLLVLKTEWQEANAWSDGVLDERIALHAVVKAAIEGSA